MDLLDLFTTTQDLLATSLKSTRQAQPHSTAKGDASEKGWLTMLQSHLPHRYRADQTFVVDSSGLRSDQIDVVIFDRQYTPLLYTHSGQKCIPAESVYAVLEVKQKLSGEHLIYAGDKAASVRRLVRTSTTITHAGGTHKPRQPFPILAGILTYESFRGPTAEKTLRRGLEALKPEARLDFGCAARGGSFEVSSWEGGVPAIEIGAPETSLIWFLLRLLGRLQGLGTVTAIEYERYLAILESGGRA